MRNDSYCMSPQYRADHDGFAGAAAHSRAEDQRPGVDRSRPHCRRRFRLHQTRPRLSPRAALIRWSAAMAGPATATYEYKWSARANGAWSVLRDWSASPALDWQPAASRDVTRASRSSVRSAAGAATC